MLLIMVHHVMSFLSMFPYGTVFLYSSNAIQVREREEDVSICELIVVCVGFMLIGNRGSTCFSGVWRPDQLPICTEGNFDLTLNFICLQSMSII